jgi:hypothetical protein
VTRPDLYDLLLRQVPNKNIHMGKRMLSFEQNDQGVTIRCSDKSTYYGDILVGADGAHSAVREHLFKLLKDNNQLSRSDDSGLPSDCVCLVGQTEVLDPKDFPEMKLSRSKFDSVLNDEYVVSTLPSVFLIIGNARDSHVFNNQFFFMQPWFSGRQLPLFATRSVGSLSSIWTVRPPSQSIPPSVLAGALRLRKPCATKSASSGSLEAKLAT